jgi:hypothetical protein
MSIRFRDDVLLDSVGCCSLGKQLRLTSSFHDHVSKGSFVDGLANSQEPTSASGILGHTHDFQE